MSPSSTKINIGDGGIGLVGLVFIILLIFQLTGAATVGWFWVFFPLWIIPAIIAVMMLGGGIGIGLAFLVAKTYECYKEKKRKQDQTVTLL